MMLVTVSKASGVASSSGIVIEYFFSRKRLQAHHAEAVDDPARDERRVLVELDVVGLVLVDVLVADVLEDDLFHGVHSFAAWLAATPVSRLPACSCRRSPRPSSWAFSRRRMILPLRVFGSLSTNSISCGMASGESFLRMKFMISSSRSSLGRRTRACSATKALTTSMLTGSGLPMAADSATASCSSSALSISNGPDQVTAGVDHVVVAAREPEVAVGVDAGPVAADVPAVQELARSRWPCCSSRSASCWATAGGWRSCRPARSRVIGSPVVWIDHRRLERRGRAVPCCPA